MRKTLKIIILIGILSVLIIGLTGCGMKEKIAEEKMEDELLDVASNAVNATKKAQKKEFEALAKAYGYEGNLSAKDTEALIKLASESGDAITLKGITTINDIDMQNTYNVSFERDEEGLISAVIIKAN